MLAILIALLLGTPAPKGIFLQTPSGGHAAQLTWNASASAGATYFIYGGAGSGKESATPLNVAALSVLAYTDSTSSFLTSGTTVCYYVKAFLGGALSPASNEWCGVVPPAPPTGVNGQTSQAMPFSVTPLPAQCVASKANTFAFTNTAIPSQAGQFQISYMAKPTAGPATAGYVTAATDGVTGLSASAASAYGNLSAIARANPATGYWDAYNLNGYGVPLVKVPYVSGNANRVTLQVNVPAQTYSVYVDGTEIAANYAFRTKVAALANLAVVSETGSVSVCSNTAV